MQNQTKAKNKVLVLTKRGELKFTEETKRYLQQFASAKRLVRFMKDSLENCTSETERKRILQIIQEKEKLVDDIYALVFQLPDSTGLAIIELYYLEDMSVDEVCSTLYISKSTYHTHHKKALKFLKERRNKL